MVYDTVAPNHYFERSSLAGCSIANATSSSGVVSHVVSCRSAASALFAAVCIDDGVSIATAPCSVQWGLSVVSGSGGACVGGASGTNVRRVL